MEVSRPATRVFFSLAWLLSCVCATPSLAFNEFSHEWITRNALDYLRSHPHAYPETQPWLTGLGRDEALMEEVLVRAVVDTDYHSDLWLDALFHKPFTGGRARAVTNMFTTIYHHLNVTRKGEYWDYDGYAYRHSSGRGNDSYLDLPSVTLRGELSGPLGGSYEGHPAGDSLGPYRLGFKGTEADWRRMYLEGNGAAEAVFPPADVPAQLAYAGMLASERAGENGSRTWNETLPLVTGLTTTEYLARHYWRGEVGGLPSGLALLGMAIHLVQDMGVPQHAEGTGDLCHPELEDLADRLACGVGAVDKSGYFNGQYGGSRGWGPYGACDRLLDPALVERLLGEIRALDPRASMTLSERMRELAAHSARWWWGDPDGTVDPLGTILPDGRSFTGDHCQDILAVEAVQEQIRYQYNLAVAATVAIFDLAAHQYETLHPRQTLTLPEELLSLLKLF